MKGDGRLSPEADRRRALRGSPGGPRLQGPPAGGKGDRPHPVDGPRRGPAPALRRPGELPPAPDDAQDAQPARPSPLLPVPAQAHGGDAHRLVRPRAVRPLGADRFPFDAAGRRARANVPVRGAVRPARQPDLRRRGRDDPLPAPHRCAGREPDPGDRFRHPLPSAAASREGVPPGRDAGGRRPGPRGQSHGTAAGAAGRRGRAGPGSGAGSGGPGKGKPGSPLFRA